MPRLTLKNVLIADAITCAAVFVIGVFDAHLLSPVLGLPETVIRTGGWICLPVAALLAFLAAQSQPNRALLTLVAVGNLGWVATSLAVAGAFAIMLTPLGFAVVIGQAAVVLAIALIEWNGARRPVTT